MGKNTLATHVQVCMSVSHLHNYTSSSVNSTGWTVCQRKGPRISTFSGGRMVSWWMDMCTFGNDTNNSYCRQEHSSVMDLLFKCPHPSLPFLLPSSLPSSLFPPFLPLPSSSPFFLSLLPLPPFSLQSLSRSTLVSYPSHTDYASES